MHIAAVGRAFPPHYYPQQELLRGFERLWAEYFHNPRRLNQVFENVQVDGRYLALPIEEYPTLTSFTEANAAYKRVAPQLGQAAIEDALARADIPPSRVDHLFFVTVTGLATPSVDAMLMNRLPFNPHLRRTPIFGLGCVAGAAGVGRVADTLRGNPDHVAVLLAVELCSLTLQQEDFSIPNLISGGLFGDGAAAVVMTGANYPVPAGRRVPRVVDSRAVFYPNTEHVMGWDIGSHGFKVILSADVPRMVQDNIRRDVDSFLSTHDLTRAHIGRYICHTGGPKVLTAFEEALEVDRSALQRTWDSLATVGNLSSASVLMVLGDTLAEEAPPPGTYGLMVAMGPAFCCEMVLLQW